jgi:hypothetical protein
LKAPRKLANLDLRAEIRLLSEHFPRFGYRRIYALLKAQGWQVNKHRKRRRKSLGVNKLVPECARLFITPPVHLQPVKNNCAECLRQ